MQPFPALCVIWIEPNEIAVTRALDRVSCNRHFKDIEAMTNSTNQILQGLTAGMDSRREDDKE